MSLCPCCSGKTFKTCCDLYLNQNQVPPTAEALMRSRYTAYSLARIDYIEKTMKAPANIGYDPVAAKQWASSVAWQKLEVLNFIPMEKKAFVEFKAYYLEKMQAQIIHEKSEFHFEKGAWFYVSREIK